MLRSDWNLYHAQRGKMQGWRDIHSACLAAQDESKSCQIQLGLMKMKLWGIEQEKHHSKAPLVSSDHHSLCNASILNQKFMAVRMMPGAPWHRTDQWQMTWQGHVGLRQTAPRAPVSRVVSIASRSLTFSQIASRDHSSFKRGSSHQMQLTQSVSESSHTTKWDSYLRKNSIRISAHTSPMNSAQDQIHGQLMVQEMRTCKWSECPWYYLTVFWPILH